jgi:hypothetical protein
MIRALHHVQLAMPAGGEAAATAFDVDGRAEATTAPAVAGIGYRRDVDRARL